LRWVSELIKPDTRSWDEDTVRKYFYPHDAEAILAIKLTQRPSDDFVAWSMEDNGIFTVRSAYRLGLQPCLDRLASGQSSSAPLGDRPVWDTIWKTPVPQKIRVFGWKAATNTLAVQQSLHRRVEKIDPVCSVCGMDVEDEHHALVMCTPARALRDSLRAIWFLPPEAEFRNSGKEWFLNMIINASKETRVKLLYLFWRVWHHRNNIVHGDGKASITASVSFLQNYLTSFSVTNAKSQDTKGKTLMFPSQTYGRLLDEVSKWQPPPAGYLMASVDAGWDALSKRAGIGVVVRDENGVVIRTVWNFLPYSTSAEEAEAHELAQLGKRESSGVLNDSAPDCVSALIANDCKPFIL
jgi:hypothetical protein